MERKSMKSCILSPVCSGLFLQCSQRKTRSKYQRDVPLGNNLGNYFSYGWWNMFIKTKAGVCAQDSEDPSSNRTVKDLRWVGWTNAAPVLPTFCIQHFLWASLSLQRHLHTTHHRDPKLHVTFRTNSQSLSFFHRKQGKGTDQPAKCLKNKQIPNWKVIRYWSNNV